MTAHGVEEMETRTIAVDVLGARSTAVSLLGFDRIE